MEEVGEVTAAPTPLGSVLPEVVEEKTRFTRNPAFLLISRDFLAKGV